MKKSYFTFYSLIWALRSVFQNNYKTTFSFWELNAHEFNYKMHKEL